MDRQNSTSSNTKKLVGFFSSLSGTHEPENTSPRPPLDSPTAGNDQRLYDLQSLVQQRAEFEKQCNLLIEEHENISTLLAKGRRMDKEAPALQERLKEIEAELQVVVAQDRKSVV